MTVPAVAWLDDKEPDAIRFLESLVNHRTAASAAAELGGDFRLDHALQWGTLPAVASESGPRARVELLEAYVESYITQEIRLDAAVRGLTPSRASWKSPPSPTRKSRT